MNVRQLSMSFALLTTAAIVSAHIGGGQIQLQDISPQVYCGRNLARILAALCYDSPDKRSEVGMGNMYNAILAPYYKEQAQETHYGWPWFSSHKARAMGSSRGKRYVVNECCDKACSIGELMNYCD